MDEQTAIAAEIAVGLGEGGHQRDARGLHLSLADEHQTAAEPFAGDLEFEDQPKRQRRIAADRCDLDDRRVAVRLDLAELVDEVAGAFFRKLAEQ